MRLHIKQILVGTTGFEPAAFCSQSRRDTKLRYVPDSGALDKIRTHDPHIRSVILYPTELLARGWRFQTDLNHRLLSCSQLPYQLGYGTISAAISILSLHIFSFNKLFIYFLFSFYEWIF